MPHLEPTTVMTLGRIYRGDMEPPLRTSFLNPPPTTPDYPQNLLRQAVMNGLQGVRGVGLGMMSPAGSYTNPPSPMDQAQYADGEAAATSAGATVATTDHANVPPPSNGSAAQPGRSYMPGPLWYGLATVSSLASVYHGYKRNGSVGWALWWGLMGTVFPLVTPTVAVAQGFAKPKRR